MTDLQKQIVELKQKCNALILSHYYTNPEIQDIADYVGDSFFLAQKGQQSKASVILLAGVVFMAESVKILNPDKIVLAPDLEAGCSLVQMTPFMKFSDWRNSQPNAIVVTYINSSVEVKALSDVICTSSNAETILRSIPTNRPVLFGPDRNLGGYLVRKTGRPMTLWEGECEIHARFSYEKLALLKQNNPNALVLAHPECTEQVLALADVIGSTSRLLEEVTNNHRVRTFIIATESGIFHQMRKNRSNVELIQAPMNETASTENCYDCPYMKKNSLPKIYEALANLAPQVDIAKPLLAKAAVPLNRMLDICAGQQPWQ
jgi:quinolinate synthase